MRDAVLSHEVIRQLVLEAPVSLLPSVSQRYGRVLLVEADGLCFPLREREAASGVYGP